jgi:hypothetical protein
MDPRESSMAAALSISNGLAVTIRALPPGDLERVAAAVRLLARESIYWAIVRKAISQRASSLTSP